jgi:hypothetical protein
MALIIHGMNNVVLMPRPTASFACACRETMVVADPIIGEESIGRRSVLEYVKCHIGRPGFGTGTLAMV